MRFRLLVALVLTVGFGVLNLFVGFSGVVDDTISDRKSLEYHEDQLVSQFYARDVNFVIYRPGRSFEIKDIKFIKLLSGQLEDLGFTVAGPTRAPLVEKGVDEDGFGTLTFDPSINNFVIGQLESGDLSLAEWISKVEQSRIYQDTFFDFTPGDAVATIPLLMPNDHDENESHRIILELIEKRKISKWEMLIYNKVQPVDEYQHVELAGWMTARPVLRASLTWDVFSPKGIPLGFLSALVIGCIFLRRLRHAVIMVLILLMVFVWTRGSLPILALLVRITGFDYPGIPTTQTPYVLIASGIWLIQAASFSIHRFNHYYRDGHWHGSQLKIVLRWLMIISVLSLFSLFTFNVRVVREVGPLSALGVFYAYLIVRHIQPALHAWLCSNEPIIKETEVRQTGLSARLDHWLVYNQAFRWSVIVVATGMVGLSLFYLYQGRVSVDTKSLSFLAGTDTHRTMTWLREDGRFGSETVEIRIEGDISDLDHFRKVHAYLSDLEQEGGVVETVHILDGIIDVVGGPPQTQEDLEYAIDDIETSGTLPEILDNLRIKQQGSHIATVAIKVSVFSNKAYSSLILREFIDRVRQFGEVEHGLNLALGGKTVTWAVQERDIRDGKITNTKVEIALMIAWGWAFVVFLNGWRHRGQRRCLGWRAGLVLVTPILFASSVIINSLVWLNIDFNQAVAVIMAFAINAAADFMFFPIAHFVELRKNNGGTSVRDGVVRTFAQTGRIVFVDATTNTFIFAPLMLLASFAPIQQIGIINVVMLISIFIGVRLLMPCLLPFTVRRR